MPKVRIGDPASPVPENAPVPGKPGNYYEAGQFAPDIDSLSTDTIAQATKAGLMDFDFPFIERTDSGYEINEKELEHWEYHDEFTENGKQIPVSQTLPKYAAASILTVKRKFPFIFKLANVSAILNGQPQTEQDRAAMKGQVALGGNALVSVITSYEGRHFRSKLLVYPDFFQYMYIPIAPAVPNRKTGISVSNYALISALGNALFNRLGYEGKYDLIGAFTEAAGWEKNGKGRRGSFLGRNNNSAWTKNSNDYTSAIAEYSLADDFADTFAQLITHQFFLKKKSPKKYEVMQTIVDKYGGINNVL